MIFRKHASGQSLVLPRTCGAQNNAHSHFGDLRSFTFLSRRRRETFRDNEPRCRRTFPPLSLPAITLQTLPPCLRQDVRELRQDVQEPGVAQMSTFALSGAVKAMKPLSTKELSVTSKLCTKEQIRLSDNTLRDTLSCFLGPAERQMMRIRTLETFKASLFCPGEGAEHSATMNHAAAAPSRPCPCRLLLYKPFHPA